MGRTFLAIALLLAASNLAMTGCATTAPKLEGSSWRLSTWSVSSMKADAFDITAKFAAGRISGRSAVNTYAGTATVGPGTTLAIGPLATTKMAGPEPAMRAEHAYLTLLADAKSFRIDGGRLTLFDAGGNGQLVFDASSE